MRADTTIVGTGMGWEQLSANEWSLQRAAAFAHDAASLSFSLEGIDFQPIVETLDKGNAVFISPKHFEMFYEGQMIGPAVLSLQDEDSLVVYPVVKAKNWPAISVEFLQMSEKDRRMVERFQAAYPRPL